MKTGLVSYQFKNGELEFNMSQIEKAMRNACGKADLLCFGESFLQGFDSLVWDVETDKEMAISQDSEIMHRLCQLTVQYQTDLLFGYIEREEDFLYSSCAVIVKGQLIHNYRRISENWKEYTRTDYHYREGTNTEEFLYHNRKIMIALCGDLWLYPERFKTEDLLIWPVYVTFTREEWKTYEQEYAEQALKACKKTVMINSITEDPVSHGNAFYFLNGEIKDKLDYDTEDILIVEV